ncbi:GDP-mannose pyrophosphatase NudK [Flavilitoribacter nigricans]|uniref:GDP-mannose pyrophosphatase n=1 Tax=Flavilitoribacter nigricans (strain ATCC 23147 / DSM 23189 / NBRC 102662 / NCIMB 1420 / SS-2) TaxID=1122177 RepID=A0A2D0NAN3_FLAN2|nr:GDP-mannose pyrophosphatase NudK [Flavilitoribacter nigricans]PHN05420.1 GDP-mannose pyrophosphatase NudK [Flavilitoribacter nigricans DSM 23189 = NBRC 102662]
MNTDIEILENTIIAQNWAVLRKITYRILKANGSRDTQTREAYDRGNGAAILLYNKQKRSVILTRQFRLPTFINGNPEGLLIEACAGILDEADPVACIKRETEEETGYQISEVEKVFEAYMSPGSVTELLYFFVAAYTEDMKLHEGGGLDEEEEDIEVLEYAFDEAYRMLENGQIRDGKTIMLLQYLKIHHFQ